MELLQTYIRYKTNRSKKEHHTNIKKIVSFLNKWSVYQKKIQYDSSSKHGKHYLALCNEHFGGFFFIFKLCFVSFKKQILSFYC